LVVALAGDDAQRARLAAGAAAHARANFWTWEQRMAAEIAAVQALVAAPRPA
jgi:hypothetical protein